MEQHICVVSNTRAICACVRQVLVPRLISVFIIVAAGIGGGAVHRGGFGRGGMFSGVPLSGRWCLAVM